jgi:hypothetical protein
VWVDPGPEKKLIIKLGPTVIEEDVAQLALPLLGVASRHL